MSRNVQILLLCACAVPWFTGAAEESMEERKRRIARKYLRERADITYSDEEVPGDAPKLGAEALLAAEQYNVGSPDMEREGIDSQASRHHQARMKQQAQQARLVENPNWLLAEAEDQPDQFANPFALESEQEDTEKEAWDSREKDPGNSQYPDEQREDGRFRSEYETFFRQPANADGTTGGESIFRPSSRFGENTQSGDPQQQAGQFPGQSDRQTQARQDLYPSTYGQDSPYSFQQTGTESEEDPAAASPRRSSTYSNPYQSQYTPYQSSYQAQQEQWQQQRGGYTPYQSSYQAQQEQRQQQRGGYTPYQSSYQAQQEQRQQQWGTYLPKQEYERQDTYEDWKKKNAPQYDPTSADAYTQEMMPQTRR